MYVGRPVGNAYAYPPGGPGYPPTVGYLPPPPPGAWGVGMQSFENQYEINPKYTPFLTKLPTYNTVMICDDSGSM